MSLVEIIDGLKLAPRIGLDKDVPEGSRYIIISDTLTQKMIESLEGFLKGLGDLAILK